MYSIVENLIQGSDATIVAVSGVVILILVSELAIMLNKFFRKFIKF